MSMASASTVATPDSVFFEFPARAYLEKYYSAVGDENSAFLRAILRYLAGTEASTDTVIEVGGGPSLFSLMAIAAHRRRAFRHLTFTDLGWKNVAEVDCWLRDDPRQFDYQPLLDWLHREVGAEQAIVTESLRNSRWDLRNLDWREQPPIEWNRHYDVVSSHFFAESATSDEGDFLDLLRKVGGLGRPGAIVLLSFMCRSAGYRIAHQDFPAISVDEEGILDDLRRAGLDLVDPVLSTAPTEDPASQPGYDGMVFVCGRLP
jgi:NNMT/PNMT/TEMT family protein